MAKTGCKSWEFKAEAEIKAVRTSQTGEAVAAVTVNGQLIFLDKEGHQVWRAELGANALDMALSSDGELMAISTADNKVHLYDKLGKLHWKLGLKATVTSVSMSSTGTLIALGALNSSAYLVDKNGKVHWTFKAGGPVRAVALSAKGTYMAIGGDDHTIHYLDSRGALRWKYTTQGRIQFLRVDANGDYVLGAADDKRIYFFDRHGNIVWNPRNPEHCRCLDMSGDARGIIVGTGNEALMFGKEGGLLRRWSGDGQVLTVAMAKNAEYGVMGTTAHKTYFMNKNGDLIWEFEAQGEITSVAMSASGDFVVSGTKEKYVMFFDNNKFFEDYVMDAKKKLIEYKRSGVNILEAEVLLQRAELEMNRKEYSSAINYALGAEKVATRIREKTRPEVSILAVIYDSLTLNQPTKVNTIIMNTGSIHAKEVRLEFVGPFEVQGERKFLDLKMNKFFETAFLMVPRQAGTVQLKVVMAFIDPDDKEFVAENIQTLTVDPVNKVKFTKSQAILQVGNIPKLVKKVQAAKTGTPAQATRPGPVSSTLQPKPIVGAAKPVTATVIRCPGCGKPVQTEWTGCPFCLTKLR
jgi:outer membrane protein assembly factor BamB